MLHAYSKSHSHSLRENLLPLVTCVILGVIDPLQLFWGVPTLLYLIW